jgi:hypothetical protein
MVVNDSVANRKGVNAAAASSPTSLLGENILNKYRLVTYNVTLATLTPDDLKDPDRYRQNQNLKYVVASSKGKAAGAISSEVADRVEITYSPEFDSLGTPEIEIIEDKSIKATVEEFNKESPGAYDLYINNLEIESVITPNQKTGNSIATKVSFDVYEPFSASGFIEALHVAALAAGWSGYLNACYLLKIEFIGYPVESLGPVSEATIITDATRYIPMKLIKTELEINETGSSYKVAGVPYNEFGFSNPGKIYTDISFSGATVGDVLRDLIAAVNRSTVERNKKEVDQQISSSIDRYEIYFPEAPAKGEKIKLVPNGNNSISKALINQFLTENSIYRFPPVEEIRNSINSRDAGGGRGGQGGATAEELAQGDTGNFFRTQARFYNPTINRIHFAKDSNIDEIITAVIRDSYYYDQYLNVKNSENPGMLDFFQIIIQVEPIGLDIATNMHKFIYKYIVLPYKVHFSQLPDQQNSSYNSKDLDPFVRRKYEYLYKGQNIDILSFNLNFNNLFFQAVPPKRGENDKLPSSDAAKPGGQNTSKLPSNAAAGAKNSQLDVAPTSSDNSAASMAGRGRANPATSYFQLAYNIHQALIDGVDLLTGEIEIVGDPFYLSTVSMGNFIPSFDDSTMTVTGEAAVVTAPIMLRINFRNPIDIDPVTGFARFSENLAQFSGVYRVLKCIHIFKDGEFKQTLSIVRYRGQQIDRELTKPQKALPVETTTPGTEVRTDSADPAVPKAGAKPNDLDLYSLVGKGIPTPGLPGNIANLVGTQNLGLKITAGATALTAGAGLKIGESLNGLNPLTAGLRVPASALSSLGNLAGPAAIAQAERIAESVLPSAGNALRNISGAGPSGIINELKSAGSNAVSAVKGITDKVSNLINPSSKSLSPAERAAVIVDANSKGIPIDQALRNASVFGVNLPGLDASPAAIAQQLGIDPAQFSGLTGGLDSNLIKKANDLVKDLPPNANLEAIKDAGVILSKVSKDTIENLPAIPPALTAAAPELPKRSFSSLLTPEQRSAVISDAMSKNIPIDQALRNASTFGVNLKGLSAEAQSILTKSNPALDVNALAGLGLPTTDMLSSKLDSVGKSINSLVPNLGSLEATALGIQNALGNPGSAVSQISQLGKSAAAQFGSLTQSVGTPLNKLMDNAVNRLSDPNAAPYTGADPIVRARLGLPPIEE